MAASVAVSVPLRVDVFGHGSIDNVDMGLDLQVLRRLLDLRRIGDSSGIDLELAITVGILDGSRRRLGGADRGGNRGRSRAVVAAWSFAAAQVQVHVLIEIARLGLNIIWVDVGHFGARGGVVAGKNWAPGVGGVGSVGTGLAASDHVISFLFRGAVPAMTVDVRDVEVVVFIALLLFLQEVFQLHDLTDSALLGL